MDRGSDKHSPLVDDQLKHETEGLVRGGHSTHAEEWKDPEPSGEDQPDGLIGNDQLEDRAELASYLGKEIYPANRDVILDLVEERQAPERVIDLVRRLPSGREFQNVGEIWAAVGGQADGERF